MSVSLGAGALSPVFFTHRDLGKRFPDTLAAAASRFNATMMFFRLTARTQRVSSQGCRKSKHSSPNMSRRTSAVLPRIARGRSAEPQRTRHDHALVSEVALDFRGASA